MQSTKYNIRVMVQSKGIDIVETPATAARQLPASEVMRSDDDEPHNAFKPFRD
jgi:hypothetical protein